MNWHEGWQWAAMVLLAYRIAILKHRVEKYHREERERWDREDQP